MDSQTVSTSPSHLSLSPKADWIVSGVTFTSYYDVKGIWGKRIEPLPFTVCVSADSEGDAVFLARSLMAGSRGFCARIDNVEQRVSYAINDTGIDWDAPWYKELDLVAFDTETGGLNPSTSPIIEMAFVPYEKDKKDFAEPLSYFVDPEGMPIDPKARALNGIDDAMLDGAKKFGDLMLEIQQKHFTNRTVLVAHNRGFDAGFLYHSIKRHNMLGGPQIMTPPLVCSMEMALSVDIGQGMNNKLGNLAKALGVEGDNSHRAGDDALLCGRVFFALARLIPEFKSMSARQFMDYFDSRMRI